MSGIRNIARYLGYVLLGILICILLAVIYIVFFFDWDHAGGRLSGLASDKSGRAVVIGKGLAVDWGWPVTRISIRNLTVANMEGGSKPTMLTLPAAEIDLDVKKLTHFHLAFPRIYLDQPDLLLEKTANGKRANWDFTKNTSGAAVAAAAPDERSEMPEIGQILIRQGTLAYKDPKQKTDIAMKLHNFEGEAKPTQQLSMEGKGSFSGKPFLLAFTGGSLKELKNSDEPYPVKARVEIGATKATLDGTVSDIFKLKGLDLALTLAGESAADLFPITGIALPPTPPYRIAGKLDYARSAETWKFQKFTGSMGDSDLSGSLTWDTSKKRPKFTANFFSKSLDFNDLGAFVGGTPGTGPGETASAKQKQEAAKRAESPYAIPDIPLDISRLSAMDADVEYKATHLRSPSLPLDDFYLHAVLNDRLLKLVPLKFGTASGDIAADITVDARQNPPAIALDGTFRKLSLAKLFEGLAKKLGSENENKGYIGGVVKLKGHGKSLHEMLSSADGNLGVGMEGGQLSNLIVELMGLDVAESIGFFVSGDKPVAVRCVVGDFGVQHGLMQSRTLVIDTSDTKISGKGQLDFKTERMDFTLHPQPKDKSFLSLKGPLHIDGQLKKPSVSLDTKSLLARAAGAAALIVTVPVASILAFIEPGLGKDSNCAQLLHSMEHDTGVVTKQEKALVPANPTPAGVEVNQKK